MEIQVQNIWNEARGGGEAPGQWMDVRQKRGHEGETKEREEGTQLCLWDTNQQ